MCVRVYGTKRSGLSALNVAFYIVLYNRQVSFPRMFSVNYLSRGTFFFFKNVDFVLICTHNTFCPIPAFICIKQRRPEQTEKNAGHTNVAIIMSLSERTKCFYNRVPPTDIWLYKYSIKMAPSLRECYEAKIPVN